jgi:RNA polymerase sigma-70 factor (ECF subfamily)
MQEVKAGGLAALQALYDRHHRGLFNFLLRFLGDRPSAEDLLQESFLRVFTSRDAYRPTAAFRTWLFTIARNLVIDHLRKRKRETMLEAEEALETVADPGAGPAGYAEAHELIERLDEAVLRLPPSEREVLLLSRFAGLTHAEIADVTGASSGAVRVALHRALRRLRDSLGPS